MTDADAPLAPLALTMGDAAGVGPEICAKAALARPIDRPLLVVGDVETMRRAAEPLGLATRPVASPEEARDASRDPAPALCVLQAGPPLADPPVGRVDARSGAAAFAAIRDAADLALAGRTAGLATAPIHKEALAAAGIDFPGHTEMLAAFSGVAEVSMMLANAALKVVLVSVHCALSEAVARVERASVLRAIRQADAGARAFGVARPRVAVAGLNPHAGEGGLFGREEIERIAPAVADARAEGVDASGPWPGDTVFMRARAGEFDVVVAQYHDQGLIPIKYLGLDDGVNVTLGLPFVRTSPDHGTAFDIAGKGVADPRSMISALRTAERLIAARARG